MTHVEELIKERYPWDDVDNIVKDIGLSRSRISTIAVKLGVVRYPLHMRKRIIEERKHNEI